MKRGSWRLLKRIVGVISPLHSLTRFCANTLLEAVIERCTKFAHLTVSLRYFCVEIHQLIYKEEARFSVTTSLTVNESGSVKKRL
jgi:hypothetical protein